MAKKSYTLSPAALAQRRANGQKLAHQVSRDYFKFLGRRGGMVAQRNILLEMAETWCFSPDQVATSKVSPERRTELEADLRAHYRQQALEKYPIEQGTKIMLSLWQ